MERHTENEQWLCQIGKLHYMLAHWPNKDYVSAYVPYVMVNIVLFFANIYIVLGKCTVLRYVKTVFGISNISNFNHYKMSHFQGWLL